jgi:hypothetical protein
MDLPIVKEEKEKEVQSKEVFAEEESRISSSFQGEETSEISVDLPDPVIGLVHYNWNFSLKTIQLESDSEKVSEHFPSEHVFSQPVLPPFIRELPTL